MGPRTKGGRPSHDEEDCPRPPATPASSHQLHVIQILGREVGYFGDLCPRASLARQSDLRNVNTATFDPQIASDVLPGLGATGLEDRRRSERVEQLVPGWVSGESSDRGAKGHRILVTDLSMHGVGFRDTSSNLPYRRGATHWLVVMGGAMRMSTRVRIASCRPNPEGGYDVGAAFF